MTYSKKMRRKAEAIKRGIEAARAKYEASNPPKSGIRHPKGRYIMGFKEIVAAIRATVTTDYDLLVSELDSIEAAALKKISAAKLALAEAGEHLTSMANAGLHELDERTILFLEDALTNLETEEKAIIAKLKAAPEAPLGGQTGTQAEAAPVEPAPAESAPAPEPVAVPLEPAPEPTTPVVEPALEAPAAEGA